MPIPTQQIPLKTSEFARIKEAAMKTIWDVSSLIPQVDYAKIEERILWQTLVEEYDPEKIIEGLKKGLRICVYAPSYRFSYAVFRDLIEYCVYGHKLKVRRPLKQKQMHAEFNSSGEIRFLSREADMQGRIFDKGYYLYPQNATTAEYDEWDSILNSVFRTRLAGNRLKPIDSTPTYV